MDEQDENPTVKAECIDRIQLLNQDLEELRSQQIKKNDEVGSNDSGLDLKYLTEPNFETEYELNHPENIEISIPSHNRRQRQTLLRLRTMHQHPNELLRRVNASQRQEEEKRSEVPSFIQRIQQGQLEHETMLRQF